MAAEFHFIEGAREATRTKVPAKPQQSLKWPDIIVNAS